MAANLQAVARSWRNLELPQLQRELDIVATDLANKQDETDTSRKKLVELSRDFKKSTPEDIRKVVAPLLKSFQFEIDNLSKRSKAAEAAFLNVYKRIIDVSDPMPTLEYCELVLQKMMRLQDLEIENNRLREALNDYNQEFREVKNQDVTIKQLKERLKELEERLEVASSVRIKDNDRDPEKHLVQQRPLHGSQMTASKILEDAKTKVNNLQSALESSQSELFDLKSRYDEDSHAKTDEMEIIVTDLERANQRAALAEKEVNQLKEQLTAATRSLQLADQIQKAPDMEQAISILTRSSLEMELAAKEKEISQLVNDIQQLHTTINTLKETSASQIAQLEEQLEERSKRIQKLEERLDVQRDYDEIKQELKHLKSTEFRNSEGVCRSPSKATENSSLLKSKALPGEAKVEFQGPSHSGLSGPVPDPGAPYPPSLQTVESFGSLLGEEIVASWHQCEVKTPPEDAPTPTEGSPARNNGATDKAPLQQQTPPQQQQQQQHHHHQHLPNGLAPTSPIALKVDKARTSGVEKMALEKLQELLRQNIEKHANDTLNTMNISRRVRELLSIHNIGQRLFAKYILGLSQGTVSELLSKPKPWDKLTEKGRDSYRKMHAWACDDGCVMVLKSLVPRKGKHCSVECGGESGAGAGGGGCAAGGGGGSGGGAPFGGPPSRLLLDGQTCDLSDAMDYHHHHHHRWGFSGKDSSGIPGYHGGGGNEDPATEERIAIILSEAQQAMKSNHGGGGVGGGLSYRREGSIPDDRSSNGSETSKLDSPLAFGPSKEHYGAAMAAAAAVAAASGRRVRKYENDDIPQEMVAKIYQEELAKLMGRTLEEGGGALMAAGGLPFTKDQYQRTQEEIRLALNVYHQELSRLTAQQMQAENGVQDLSLPKGERREGPQQGRENESGSPNGKLVNGGSQEDLPERERSRTPRERSSDSPLHSKVDSLRHAGSAFTLVRPKSEPADESTSPVCTAASPLQRMQSITNSLISQPTLPAMPSLPQRPLKAVLPPITQYQFDQYTNLNTEDIVKKVKEQLSQFSISQRLFGESVLGLSQGSVSDLLARPKPWHMLTQKGREPFIRMKIFLEDENAVHKLVASQYKIAPEKLMRTGSGYGPSPPGTSKHQLFSTMKEPESPKGHHGGYTNSHHHHHHHHHHHQSGQSHHHTHSSAATVNQVHLPSLMAASSPQDLTRSSMTAAETAAAVAGKKSSNAAAAATAAAVYRAVSHLQPSVYEMAALTQDLDTQLITTKIKETLLANNIGQKIFGEAVLGLSQGSVSELLSKPKPWHMLSIKGREPFIRMQLWLSDPHNVDRLQALKNERREANKRRRSTVEYLEGMETLENNNHIHHGNGSLLTHSPIGSAPKKPRVLFSEEQKEALRIAFALDPYPSTTTIEFLAQELGLTPRTITNWFHNHRMRLKQQVPHNVGSSPRGSASGDEVVTVMAAAGSVNGREGSTFDPSQFRALLNQRLIEMQKEKSGMMAGSLGTLPYSYYSNSSSPLSGLDLSVSSSCHGLMHVKREPRDLEVDSNLSCDYNDDDSDSSKEQSYTPGSASGRLGGGTGGDLGSADPSRRQTHGSSSRRKPAAPQWVNPGWDAEEDMGTNDLMDDDDEDEKSDDEGVAMMEVEEEQDVRLGSGRGKRTEVIINGVCVRQTSDFDLPSHDEEETVRVEPAPAPDHESAASAHPPPLRVASAALSSSPHRGSGNSSPALAERAGSEAACCSNEDGDESAGLPSPCGVGIGQDSEEDEPTKERIANIERLEKSLHEQEESWEAAEEANEERQSNIEKLEQRIRKEEAEDWEF